MNGKGAAAALVLMFLVTAVRLGDKPVFRDPDGAESMSKGIEKGIKEFNKARKTQGQAKRAKHNISLAPSCGGLSMQSAFPR